MCSSDLYISNIFLQAGLLPAIITDAANLCTASERLIQEHLKKYKNGSADLKDLIQQVLHHPDFKPDEVDHDMHERLMSAIVPRWRLIFK